MTDELSLLSFEEYSHQLILQINDLVEEENGRPELYFLDEMIQSLDGLKAEWEEDPGFYVDNRIQAAVHSEDWEKLYVILADYHGENEFVDAVYSSSKALYNRFESARKTILLALKGQHCGFEESNELRDLCNQIYVHRETIKEFKYYLITDFKCPVDELPDEIIDGRSVNYQIWSLEKIYNLYVLENTDSGTIEINLAEDFGERIPCIAVDFGDIDIEYDSYLGFMKGSLLADLYEKYNEKLLEGNIRVFLQTTTSVNKGILSTLSNPVEKTRFFAYNNGISATAESVVVSQPDENGVRWIEKIRGLQIVNGGQTTASMHTARKKSRKNVEGVYVQMKLTVPGKSYDINDLNSKIARYSNTQNQIKKTDFTANDSFQRKLEQLSRNIKIPGKEMGWFYERTRGQHSEGGRLYDLKGKRDKAKELAFDSRFPKSRKLTKTDIALHYNTWNQLPYYAARGGEKNFQKYLSNLEGKNGDITISPDERYFREQIAMSILFISIDQLVDDWQNGRGKYGVSKFGKGYKREVVVYTLSLLSYLTAKNLNLERIWNEQINHGVTKKTIRMPDVLEEFVHQLMQFVESQIRKTPEDKNDVREWAKTEGAWIAMKKAAETNCLTVPENILNEFCLNHEDAIKHVEWLQSLQSEKTEDMTSENPDTETDAGSDDNTPKKNHSALIPDDLSGFLTRSSVMEISKFISQLQYDKVIDDNLIKILQLVLARRKARMRIPDKMIKDIIELFASIDKKSESCDNNDDDDEDRQTDDIIPGNVISANETEIKDVIFEYHSKGGFGKMILGDNDTYILLKGSTMSLDDAPSFRDTLRKRREEMLQKSELIRNPDGKTATLMKDMVMDSSGAAAAFVSANNPSGPGSWKYNGMTLKKYEEQIK